MGGEAVTGPPLRVALFTDTFAPEVNGVARTLTRLVDHLQEGGHQVALVAPRPRTRRKEAVGPEPQGSATLRQLPVPGVPLFLYPELLLTGLPGRHVRRELATFDPQVVHCATESVLGWWGRRWALRGGRPLVTSFHTQFPEYAAGYGLGFAKPLAWSLLRRFHRPALHTLCPSEATRKELEAQGFHPRVRIWSRGVDSRAFSPEHRSQALREELAPGAEVILLYVGRLAPEKRLGLLVEAFPRVRDACGRRVALVLVGDGPMREELEARKEPGVHFAGYRTGHDLAAAYASADLFAFPSDTETFGNVVVEAMASGLPVVGVDRGGVRDTIRPGETGFRVPPGDVEAFSQALLTLVGDEALRARMAAQARSDAAGRSWPRILDGVVETYREVAA